MRWNSDASSSSADANATAARGHARRPRRAAPARRRRPARRRSGRRTRGRPRPASCARRPPAPRRRRRRSPGRAATAPSRSEPVRGARDQRQRAGVVRDVLRRRGCASMRAADQRRRQRLQVELQAARQHGHRNLLRVGRRQHELDVLGRLLERLQHRVERGLRQHVHFVDQVDLVAADRRRVARVVEDLAHVVDAGVRRGVELEQVDEAAGVDVDARGADAARRRR